MSGVVLRRSDSGVCRRRAPELEQSAQRSTDQWLTNGAWSRKAKMNIPAAHQTRLLKHDPRGVGKHKACPKEQTERHWTETWRGPTRTSTYGHGPDRATDGDFQSTIFLRPWLIGMAEPNPLDKAQSTGEGKCHGLKYCPSDPLCQGRGGGEIRGQQSGSTPPRHGVLHASRSTRPAFERLSLHLPQMKGVAGPIDQVPRFPSFTRPSLPACPFSTMSHALFSSLYNFTVGQMS